MDVQVDPDAYERVPPGDPNRCAGVGRTSGSECPFRAMPGVRYCKMHGGDLATKWVKKEAFRLYNLEKYRGQVDRLSAPSVVNLDEELGVLRMLLETMLNTYEHVELLTNSGTIGHLVGQINAVLTNNQKLKSQMGQLMDRAAISRLCDAIVAIVVEEVAPERLDAVSAKVAGAIAAAVSDAS